MLFFCEIPEMFSGLKPNLTFHQRYKCVDNDFDNELSFFDWTHP